MSFKKIVAYSLFLSLVLSLVLFVEGFSDADVASRNISQKADYFEIYRRVVFYNGITGEYILEIDGFCSLGNDRTDKEISITCKTGPGQYKKHFLGLSDNVTYFSEQLENADVKTAQYKVILKPSVVVPDVGIK
jgi:hypothetical protein